MNPTTVRQLIIGFAMIVQSVSIPVDAAPRIFKRRPPAPELSPKIINDPATAGFLEKGSRGAAVLRAAILLERAHFSSGEMDAIYGINLAKAVAAYQKANSIPVTGEIDADTWALLNRDTADPVVMYTVTSADVADEYVKIPTRMMAKSKLERLGYRSPAEQFGERFRVSPDLLVRLNPGKDLRKEGTEIVVPNVAEVVAPGKAAYVVVDKSDLALTAYDAGDMILAHYPATIGSKHDPLPIGTWKINGVARNPVYNYNPRLFWDAEEGDRKAKIAAGPNNPVGVVWIDLSKEHYGIHGTPEPSTIGKSYSHGCIRLTNWSALELAGMVSPGVKVILQE